MRSSEYTYPPDYTGPKPINEQINIIAELFGLDPTKALEYAKNLPILPKGAEGWFAIPRTEALGAKYFPEITHPVRRYCAAVNLTFDKLRESRSFYNVCNGKIDEAHLRGNPDTIKKFSKVKEQQEGDIIIIPAQLGMLHADESVKKARKTFKSNEYGLGAFAICCILLTHPERLATHLELEMDCPGDECSEKGNRLFLGSPLFCFNDNRVEFDLGNVSDAYPYYGSTSGFVPKV